MRSEQMREVAAFMTSPKSNPEALIQTAQREILDTYRKETEQLATAFRDLDAKAQGTATIAGGFLAASLAFLNRQGSLVSLPIRGVLLIGVLGLVSAIVFSLLALKIRNLTPPPSGEDVRNLLSKLANEPDYEVRTERLLYFYGDASELWRTFVEERRVTNLEKANHIWSAQKSLLATALSVSLILIMIIASP